MERLKAIQLERKHRQVVSKAENLKHWYEAHPELKEENEIRRNTRYDMWPDVGDDDYWLSISWLPNR